MINVTAGILFNNDDKVLIAKRRMGRHLGGYWEFPGGKIEEGEIPEESVIREFSEEFDVRIEVVQLFLENIHSYPEKAVKITSYIVKHICGEFVLRDHDEMQWVSIQDLLTYQLAPADVPIAERLKRNIQFEA